MSVRRSPATSFVSKLMEILRESTPQNIMIPVREVATKRGGDVPNTEVCLTFLKYGSMMGVSVPTMTDADLEREL